jgi:DNA-binding Lrp family transcriptional regulator
LNEPALRHASGERTGPEIRLIIRMSMTYALDTIALVRGGRSVLDILLLGAIAQANVAAITRDLDLQRTYAEAGDVLPDALRRPISVNALAASLRQPFETVRRRVKRLIAEGVCEHVEGGLIIPGRAMSSPEYLAHGLAAYERLRRFYIQLRDLDLLPPIPPDQPRLAEDALPVRAMARLTIDYLLRTVEGLVQQPQDLMDSLITLEVFRGNVAAMRLERRGGPELISRDMVPDGEREPVSISLVAQRLGLPHETVRRRVHGLVARGWCRPVGAGFIVPAETLANGAFREVMVANMGHLQRLFSGLAAVGILGLWDAQV